MNSGFANLMSNLFQGNGSELYFPAPNHVLFC